MQKFLIILVAIVVLGFIARVAIGFFSVNRVATGVVTTENIRTLSGCDGLHNCTASTATTKKNHIAAFNYTGDASMAIAHYSNVIAAQSNAQIVTQDATYLHATFKTTLLGYIDDLELLLDAQTGTLHIRSASRIGKSDFGANRKRINALRVLATKS